MSGGVGTEGEAMLLGGMSQIVQHATWLHDAETLVRFNTHHIVHVFGEIHDDGNITTLACQTGSTASR
ncbi:MAG TPA: hypothetical protein VGN12_01290 [Pirellulales bacterium]